MFAAHSFLSARTALRDSMEAMHYSGPMRHWARFGHGAGCSLIGGCWYTLGRGPGGARCFKAFL